MKENIKQIPFKWYVIFVYPSNKAESIAEKIRNLDTHLIRNCLSISEIAKNADIQHEFVFVKAILTDQVKRKILGVSGVYSFYKNNYNPIVLSDFSKFLATHKTKVKSVALAKEEKQKVCQINDKIMIKTGFLEGAIGIIKEICDDSKIRVELDLYNTNMVTEVDIQNIEFID